MESTAFNKKPIPFKMQNQADSLISDPQLYVVTEYVNEDGLKNIFKDIDNIRVEFRHQSVAVLHFATIENAEKAYAIYNNIKVDALNKYLRLYIHDPSNIGDEQREPQSSAIILQVRGLPPNTTNLTLYQHFRQFGPLFSCRIQFNQPDNKFKGSALVQFYRQEDADSVLNSTQSKNFGDKMINIQNYTKNNNTPKIRTSIGNNSNFNLPSAVHAFSGTNNNNNNHNNNNNINQAPMSPGPEGPLVDPCNLFIKNLDANISSSDLFNQFRRFGRIISARVMRDQDTGNSKGFGFVSYTSADDADKAKTSMHGKTLGTKQIVVRLHEPKKLREAKLANHFNGSPASPSESRAPSRRNSDFLNINVVNEFGQEDLNGLAPKARKEVLMSELQKRFKYITIPADEVNPVIEQLLSSKVSEVLQMLKDASLLNQKITDARNFIHDRKRRGNEETNVPTTIVSNNINNNFQQISQRDKFLKAITKICPRNSVEILDLLMTLSPKERSLCLFNDQYLNKKIIEANEALELANHDDENPKSIIASNPPSIEPIPHSKSNFTTTDVPAVVSNGIQTPEYKEIEDFMETLKNKPIHEKKQKLGDKLFPKVKSLGLKSAIASKVTINLLDTDDLHELAHSMNDQEKFQQKVQAAATKVKNPI